MISIFLAPPTVATHRPAMAVAMTTLSISQRPSSDRPAKVNDDFWTQLLLETLGLEDEPVRITTIVNNVVACGNFTIRSEREAKKIELFKLIGKMIRQGRLERVGRNYAALPATDEKYQAYLARAAAPLDLPEPCV